MCGLSHVLWLEHRSLSSLVCCLWARVLDPSFYAVGKELKQWLYHSCKYSWALWRSNSMVAFKSRLGKFEVMCVFPTQGWLALVCRNGSLTLFNSAVHLICGPTGHPMKLMPSCLGCRVPLLCHFPTQQPASLVWCQLAACAAVYSCRSRKDRSCSVNLGGVKITRPLWWIICSC